jgi:hypothetical protein
MGIRIGHLVNNTRRCEIPLGEAGVLNVTYRPSAFNAAQEQVERDLRDQGAVLRSMAESLVAAVISWDLLDDDGEPVPLTHEVEVEVEGEDGEVCVETRVEPHPVVMSLGFDNLVAISNGILEDLLPNVGRSGASAAGSSAKRPTANSRNARTGGR